MKKETKVIYKAQINDFKFGFTNPDDENEYCELGVNIKSEEAAKLLKISVPAMEAIAWNFEELIELARSDMAELLDEIEALKKDPS